MFYANYNGSQVDSAWKPKIGSSGLRVRGEKRLVRREKPAQEPVKSDM